jgi:hypothetical protein
MINAMEAISGVGVRLRELLMSTAKTESGLTENFAEDVSQGELARLAGVDRYHLLRFLDHARPCPSLSFLVLTLGSADRTIKGGCLANSSSTVGEAEAGVGKHCPVDYDTRAAAEAKACPGGRDVAEQRV